MSSGAGLPAMTVPASALPMEEELFMYVGS